MEEAVQQPANRYSGALTEESDAAPSGTESGTPTRAYHNTQNFPWIVRDSDLRFAGCDRTNATTDWVGNEFEVTVCYLEQTGAPVSFYVYD